MAKLPTLRTGMRTLDHRTAVPPPKRADPELQTKAHEEWRLEVLNRAGWKCQWPGCDVRGGRGHKGVRLYADHIKERSDGGSLTDPANGQCLCARHHSLKTAQARAARHGLTAE